MMKKTICPQCGGPKDYRATTCLACRPTSPITLAAVRNPANKMKPWTREEAYSRLVGLARREEGCLLATTGTNNDGYRRLRAGGIMVLAHRLTYEMEVGPIPEGLTIDHECHNLSECAKGSACPHRRCIDPTHLVIRSRIDNWRRGRQGFPAIAKTQTHCKRGHEFTEANTYRFGPEKTYRQCRRCKADAVAERRRNR